jgi:hypothetical protein
MTADDNAAAHAGGEHAVAADQEYLRGGGLSLAGWSVLRGRRGAPPWMRAELVRLRAAFPAFSFTIRPGWRGPMFEAFREQAGDGLYAVITRDAGELWHELDRSRSGPGPVAGRRGDEAR